MKAKLADRAELLTMAQRLEQMSAAYDGICSEQMDKARDFLLNSAWCLLQADKHDDNDKGNTTGNPG